MGRHSTGCLDLHGAHYRLRVQGPRHLRGSFNGQHSLVQVLPTDSKVEANRMKNAVLELMLEQIQLAERRQMNEERTAPIDKQMLWAGMDFNRQTSAEGWGRTSRPEVSYVAENSPGQKFARDAHCVLDAAQERSR